MARAAASLGLGGGAKDPTLSLHGDPAISAALGRSERVPLWIEVVDFPET